jgi:hypothetical protein
MTVDFEELMIVVGGADWKLKWRMIEFDEAVLNTRCSSKRNPAFTSW